MTLIEAIGLALVRCGGSLLLLFSVFTLLTAPLVPHGKGEALLALPLLMASIGLMLRQRWGTELLCGLGGVVVLLMHSEVLELICHHYFDPPSALWVGVDIGAMALLTGILHRLSRHMKNGW